MLIEERILGRQRGVDQVLGDLVERHHGAFAAVRVVELPQQLTLAIEDLGGLEAGVVADRAQRRQVAGEHGVAGRGALQQDEDADQADADERHEQARADHQWRSQPASGADAVAVFSRGLQTVQPLQSVLRTHLRAAPNIQRVPVTVAVTAEVVPVTVPEALHCPR